jgi:DNA (cytosine-5)-methyltransferase 1
VRASFKAVSLFSGIDGLNFGFEKAGFETRVAVGIGRHAWRTSSRSASLHTAPPAARLPLLSMAARDTETRYEVSWRLIRAAEHGVPQIRERVFLVGSRDGRKFRFPEPTHVEASSVRRELLGGTEPYRTAWDVLGDLPEPDAGEPGLKVRGKWGELLPTIPEGENYLWHTDRGGGYPLFGWRTRYWSFLLKLAKRLPSWTVQAQPGAANGPFHWKNRRLTFRELCRIQTFPDAFAIASSSRTEMQRMLGNAVPPLLAEIIAREIRRQFFGAALNTPLVLLPPRRKRVPRAEALPPLPPEYRSLIGCHEAHPGTGGRQSIKRAKERVA